MEIDATAIEFLTESNKIVISKDAFYAEFERRRDERKKEKRKEQNRIYYLKRKERILAQTQNDEDKTN